jgi:hypothetical protein
VFRFQFFKCHGFLQLMWGLELLVILHRTRALFFARIGQFSVKRKYGRNRPFSSAARQNALKIAI